MNMSNKPFIPSSWHLLQQIKAAEAKCDADCEQATLRAETAADARMERAWVAQSEANRRRSLWGDR